MPASPTSFIGVIVGVAGGSGLPSVSITKGGVAFEFHKNGIQDMAGNSTTYGHVIVYDSSATMGPGGTRPHELAHVEQHVYLGEAYLPMHILAGTYSTLTAGNWHTANWLEQGPMSSPPCPFP